MTNILSRCYSFPYHTDGKLKYRESSNLPKVAVSKWKAEIQMQAIGFQSLGSEPLTIFRQCYSWLQCEPKYVGLRRVKLYSMSLGIPPSFLGFSVVLFEIYSLFYNIPECHWQIPFLYRFSFYSFQKQPLWEKMEFTVC